MQHSVILPTELYFLLQNVAILLLRDGSFSLTQMGEMRGKRGSRLNLRSNCFQHKAWMEAAVCKELLMLVVPTAFL